MNTKAFHIIFKVVSLLLIFVVIQCKNEVQKDHTVAPSYPDIEIKQDSTEFKAKIKRIDYDTTLWYEITERDSMHLSIKYATPNNFTKTQIYKCPRCFVRPALAERLKNINRKILTERKLRLIFFDCYRPLAAQQKLWDQFPNEIYVTHPKKGSMHNRGAAVDIGFIDINDKILDMGTPFDYFGVEAHHNYRNLNSEIIERRQYLKNTMESFGFKSITSEWWHYSLSGSGAQISDWVWNCGL